MNKEFNGEKSPYRLLFDRINITFKLWIFSVIGGAIFGMFALVFMLANALIFVNHGTVLGSGISIVLWILWLVYTLTLFAAFIALIVYQTSLYLSFTEINESVPDRDIRNFANNLKNLLLVTLILHLVGVFTLYLLGSLAIVIFVLNIVFFVKAQEFKRLVSFEI